MTKPIVIIVAAGQGTRIGGDIPKQFRTLLGRRVIDWSLDAFARHPSAPTVVVVVPNGRLEKYAALSAQCDHLVEGGATRAQSVAAGLNAISHTPHTPVLIHDAARPGLSQQMITRLLDALENADAAAPALKVPDALKDVSGTHLKTVDRNPLRRMQTPQVFRYGDIHSAIGKGTHDYVDDLEAVEALGRTVKLVAGEARLGKITYEEDFDMIASLMTGGSAIPRIGSGYDVHQFGIGDHVTLCGTRIPHSHGLVGHSDADIGWHALTDAILGAVACGDIGDHFPPSDPQWKDADSGVFLAHAAKLAREAGYMVANVDITLICEAPKIKPHREAMRENTARVLGLPIDQVSVKATTTETLGFEGRREGMAGQAVAILAPVPKLD
ncbi:MAG: bifunctional 2-C-methyl-D-erythritol 4-phosphate cytidylyltransferase/2-C-methyl-D-erythritol 2,4-cyclodiphosphate synthase [Hyphomonadaceae bacterium]